MEATTDTAADPIFGAQTDEQLQVTFDTAQQWLVSGYCTSRDNMRVAQSTLQRSSDELERRGYQLGWSKR